MTSLAGPNSRGAESETVLAFDPAAGDEAHHCITCSDEGCPLTVVRVDAARGLALCEAVDGRRSTVEIALVEGAAPGAVLLVHAGTALTLLEEAA